MRALGLNSGSATAEPLAPCSFGPPAYIGLITGGCDLERRNGC